MDRKNPKLFGIYFRQFRLRAGFSSLASLASDLANYGFVYEDSSLSRWQNGSRIPSNRNVLLCLIKIFSFHQGITNVKEANKFLETAGHGFLTDLEQQQILPKDILEQSPFQVPPDIFPFIGRKKEISQIKKLLLKGNGVLISGPAGIGKTALSIKIAHRLRNYFPDGVLWLRLDTSRPMTILSNIAFTYGKSVSAVRNLHARSDIIRSLLSQKRALLIFDNARSSDDLQPLLPHTPSCSFIVTSRLHHLEILGQMSRVHLPVFSLKESLELFSSIHSQSWVKNQTSLIHELCFILGYLPLGLKITAQLISRAPKWQRSIIIEKLYSEKTRLDTLIIENTGIRASFNQSYQLLPKRVQNFFSNLSIFAGNDFSLEAAASISIVDKQLALEMLEQLHQKSLIERALEYRYRLHPLLRLFAAEKLQTRSIYGRAASYYTTFLASKRPREKTSSYTEITHELDNILDIFQKCFERKLWKHIIAIWKFLGPFLWNGGYWNEVRNLGEQVHRAAKKVGDVQTRISCGTQELSWVYFWQGDLQKAEQYAREGLLSAEELHHNHLVALAKQRLGKIYQAYGMHKKSLLYLHESLAYFQNAQDDEHIGDTLTYIGESFILLGQYKEAKKYLLLALHHVNKINDLFQKAIILTRIGNLSFEEKDYQVAKDSYFESLKIEKEAGRRAGGMVWNNIGLGIIQSQINKSRHSRKYFRKAISEINYLGIKNQIKSRAILGEAGQARLKEDDFYTLLSHSR